MSRLQNKRVWTEDRTDSYKIGKKLGAGSFGDVHECKDRRGHIYAIKIERRRDKHGKRRRGPSQTQYEYRVYQHLATVPDLPRAVCFLKTHKHNCLVMPKLGESVQQVFDKNNRSLSSDVILAIGIKILAQLQAIHDRGIIHRDIKPQNILLGNNNTITLIDFGLAKRFLDEHGDHIPLIQKRGLTGTPRYCSVNALAGLEQSRRDDLEALLYVLIYLYNGALPWSGVKGDTRSQNHARILHLKKTTDLAALCGQAPPVMERSLRYVRSLDFAEMPSYRRLLRWLRRAHKESL